MSAPRRVLLTGATGFVGSALRCRLVAAGWQVRAATRHPENRPSERGVEWVYCDVDDAESTAAALNGCSHAFYFVHSMSEGGDYAQKERQAALSFAKAAGANGIQRIVYLGGVQPLENASRHLASRAETGAALATSQVPVVELRAAMIVGAGSASWNITRDLALRLPAMLLPRWLESRSEPVAAEDVFAALIDALDREGIEGIYGVPGPDVLSARQILFKVAALRGTQPLTLNIPLLTPRLSSGWVQLVTRAEPRLARELVEGLKADLLNTAPSYWHLMGHRPQSFEDSAKAALAAETGSSSKLAAWIEGIAGHLSRGAPTK